MLSSTIVDIAIGLTFVYLLLSLVASALSELLESFLRFRAKDLERGVRELLNDSSPDASGLTGKFYEHPLISGLFRGAYKPRSRTLPTYIPSRAFALALMDIVLPATDGPTPNGGTVGAIGGGTPPSVPAAAAPLAPAIPGAAAPVPPAAPAAPAPPVPGGVAALGPVAPPAIASFREAIASLKNPQIQRALLALTDAANNDPNKVRENIEAWFNSSMDRVSGWFKRRTHWILFGIGLVLAALVGANSIDIVTTLAADRPMREFLVAQASEEVRSGSLSGQAPPQSTNGNNASDSSISDAREQRLQQGLKKLTAAGVLPGPEWNKWCPRASSQPPPCTPRDWHWLLALSSLGGCFLTASAVSLGAPFWFDLLNKFVVVRSTVKPKEKSPDEKSKA